MMRNPPKSSRGARWSCLCQRGEREFDGLRRRVGEAAEIDRHLRGFVRADRDVEAVEAAADQRRDEDLATAEPERRRFIGFDAEGLQVGEFSPRRG